MKAIYTRPSGKQFECEILHQGQVKSTIKYKDGKYIATQLAFNKHLTKIENK